MNSARDDAEWLAGWLAAETFTGDPESIRSGKAETLATANAAREADRLPPFSPVVFGRLLSTLRPNVAGRLVRMPGEEERRYAYLGLGLRHPVPAAALVPVRQPALVPEVLPALPAQPEPAAERRLAAADPAQLMLFARQALENARTIPDIREAAARAEALKTYFRDSRVGVIWENEATAYKLDCLRKAGRLLAEELGGQIDSTAPQATGQIDSTVFRTLEELKVTKYESSRWQQMAAVPDEEFLRWVEENRQRERGITAEGLISLERARWHGNGAAGAAGDPSSLSAAGKNGFYTPKEAVEPLYPFLRALGVGTGPVRIWEPACGTGNIVEAMRENGLECLGTDLYHPDPQFRRNFLLGKHPGWAFDAIVTNPPRSDVTPFLHASERFGLPFALLMALDAGFEGKERLPVWVARGLDVILFDRRICFETPNGRKGMDSNPQIAYAWFCSGLPLPAQLNLWLLNEGRMVTIPRGGGED